MYNIKSLKYLAILCGGLSFASANDPNESQMNQDKGSECFAEAIDWATSPACLETKISAAELLAGFIGEGGISVSLRSYAAILRAYMESTQPAELEG